MSNGIKRFKCFVNALYGQTHDIEIATVKGCDTDMANRYLDKCTPMERKELIDFPISRYFKEEEDHTADNPVLPEE